jgi:hypothetical protein
MGLLGKRNWKMENGKWKLKTGAPNQKRIE